MRVITVHIVSGNNLSVGIIKVKMKLCIVDELYIEMVNKILSLSVHLSKFSRIECFGKYFIIKVYKKTYLEKNAIIFLI